MIPINCTYSDLHGLYALSCMTLGDASSGHSQMGATGALWQWSKESTAWDEVGRSEHRLHCLRVPSLELAILMLQRSAPRPHSRHSNDQSTNSGPLQGESLGYARYFFAPDFLLIGVIQDQ